MTGLCHFTTIRATQWFKVEIYRVLWIKQVKIVTTELCLKFLSLQTKKMINAVLLSAEQGETWISDERRQTSSIVRRCNEAMLKEDAERKLHREDG